MREMKREKRRDGEYGKYGREMRIDLLGICRNWGVCLNNGKNTLQSKSKLAHILEDNCLLQLTLNTL